MKKVNIQSLSLMMMIAMIYAAPHKQTDEPKDTKCGLLEDIKQEVNNIIRNKMEWNNIFVPKIPKKNYATCPINFFCCAEESLNGTGLTHITRILHRYNNINKEKENTNCSLEKTHQVTLHAVLKEIHHCTTRTLEKRNATGIITSGCII